MGRREHGERETKEERDRQREGLREAGNYITQDATPSTHWALRPWGSARQLAKDTTSTPQLQPPHGLRALRPPAQARPSARRALRIPSTNRHVGTGCLGTSEPLKQAPPLRSPQAELSSSR